MDIYFTIFNWQSHVGIFHHFHGIFYRFLTDVSGWPIPLGSCYRFYHGWFSFWSFFIPFSKCSALELHAGIFEAFWKTGTLSMLIPEMIRTWSSESYLLNNFLSCLYEMMVVFIKNMGVSKNTGKPPKWMVYNGNPYQNGWFGGKTHYFWKHPNMHT